MSTAAKRPRIDMSQLLSVQSAPAEGAAASYLCTHSGTFHADEALAIAMLRLLPRFASHVVLRSRDPKVHAVAEVLVDVGAVYDASTGRFDHHQASFTSTMDETRTVSKLSSAGLIYKHYGKEIIAHVAAELGSQLDEATLDKVYYKTYDKFIKEIDAIDNGVDPCPAGVKPLYKVETGLSSRIGRLNPAWNEAATEEDVNAAFKLAVAMAGEEFMAVVGGYIKHWLPARSIVVAARETAAGVHPSGKILVLESFCPWKEHLLELEADDAATGSSRPAAVYIVFGDSSGSWRVQATPVDSESFACKKALPAPWRGLRDAELSAAAGVEGCIFVHAAGFIGGAKTKEGALALAVKALEME